MFKKILALVVLASVSTVAFAQGTVNFNTLALGTSAQVYQSDGVTLLSGATYMAQLFAGPGTTAESALVAVGNPVGFRTSANAGYVQTTGTAFGSAVDPVVTISAAAAGGAVTVQLRAWDATYASYALAKASLKGNVYGQSALLALAATGNPNGSPPSTPVNLDGLKGFNLNVIPEPTTLALVLLGGAALLIRRRK